ncbi:hypothetical protein MKK68_08200 [Methylobacterium sp. E-016]|uniref:hypothetical protein n=1 Tax=Methylobacterium sp. E-016 TaxID=2836556 RepID=UPI001FBBC23C|nr:hypothetical protein [Methylobacterium sp. E-016]MCJ2075633.1 hypothetical protein [Methylobacterium sp. E-016]
MRYANLIPTSHSADPRLTAAARRAVITAKAAVVSATESAKRFARCEAASEAVPRVASAECAMIAFAPLLWNG